MNGIAVVARLAIAAAAMARGLTAEQAQRAADLLMDGTGRPLPESVEEAYQHLDDAFTEITR